MFNLVRRLPAVSRGHVDLTQPPVEEREDAILVDLAIQNCLQQDTRTRGDA